MRSTNRYIITINHNKVYECGDGCCREYRYFWYITDRETGKTICDCEAEDENGFYDHGQALNSAVNHLLRNSGLNIEVEIEG